MVKDLEISVELHMCPIVRDHDGLASLKSKPVPDSSRKREGTRPSKNDQSDLVFD